MSKAMEDNTRTTYEKLDVSGKSPLPSMLFIKKHSMEADASGRAAESEALQKRGRIMLDRIKKFVPEMESSAKALEERLQRTDELDSIDIENVKEGAPAVEFNLGLFECPSSDSEDEGAELDTTDESESDLSEEEAVDNPSNDNIVFLKKRNPGGSR